MSSTYMKGRGLGKARIRFAINTLGYHKEGLAKAIRTVSVGRDNENI